MDTMNRIHRERRTEEALRAMDYSDIVARVHALEDALEAKDAEIERLKVLLSHWWECWADGCNPDGDVIEDTDAALATDPAP